MKKELTQSDLDKLAIAFADWVQTLTVTQRVSVWSKNGGCGGVYALDNEQLLKKYKKLCVKSHTVNIPRGTAVHKNTNYNI